MFCNYRAFWLSIALTLCVSSAQAQQLSDMYSARALGMGGAVRAFASDSTALELNPAALASLASYQAELGYRYYASESSHMLRTALLDAITSKVATGISYDWTWANAVSGPTPSGWTVVGEEDGATQVYRSHDAKLGIGVPLGRLALGTTLVWHRYKQSSEADLDTSAYSSKFTFIAASEFRPIPTLNFALVGTNLLPTGIPSKPTTISLGFSAAAGQLAVADVDVTANLTGLRDLNDDEEITRDNVTYDLNLGGQLLLARAFPLRLGYFTERYAGRHYLTSGVGIEAGQIRLSYGMSYQLGNDEENASEGRFYHMFMLGSVLGPMSQNRGSLR